jgi:hypothetical protein
MRPDMRPTLFRTSLALLALLAGCERHEVQVTEGTSSETVIGMVFLPGGEPAANVKYRLRDMRFLANPTDPSLSKVSAAQRTESVFRDGRTGPDGAYRIDSVGPGEYLLAFQDGPDLGLALPVTVRPGQGEVGNGRDTLRATAVLTGTLATANQEVQAGTLARALIQLYGFERIATADSTGRFRFASLPAGRVHVRASSPFPYLQSAELAGISLRPGDTTDVGEIRLNRILTSNFTSLVPDGLIAYWPCDEGAGMGTVDPVGGHDGRLTGGPQWTQGVMGGAIAFDGVDDYIAIPDMYLDGDFSITAWVRLRGLIDNNQVLLGRDDSTNLNFAERRFRIYSGDSSRPGLPPGDQALANIAVTAGAWTHVAVTRAAGALTLYVNGREAGTGSWGGVFLFNQLARGLRLVGGAKSLGFLQGDLDEVRIYNRALQPADVGALAKGTAGP